MKRDEKTAVVEEIAGQLTDAEAVFAVDYRGISVPEAAELRAKLREAEARFRVVKNRLTVLAAEKAGQEHLKEHLNGPTALTFVKGDVALAAKALNDFARQLDALEFKGGLMNGEPLEADQIKALARLPARDVLDAQLVGLVASPITGLARGLNALIAGLASQLRQIEEQGLVGGGEPAAEEAHAEEAPAEEAPAEEAPAEEAPAETATEPVPAEEQPDQSPPEPDAPAEDSAGTETETSDDEKEDG